MNEELQIKVQALLDGELPEAEAREVLSLIARDAGVAALHNELKNTRQALAKFDRHIQVPELREFYWSKIQRELGRLEPPQPEKRPGFLWIWLRRSLIPATGLCAVVLAFLILSPAPAPAPLPIASGQEPEQSADAADSGAMTYRDEASGATLVWLSFPAENDKGD
jgi:anti-sigma factor RsiW